MYLLDTNTCVFYIKGLFQLKEKFKRVGPAQLAISEITLAELKFGVENSDQIEKNKLALEEFLSQIQIIPIFNALDFYAKEKARLRKAGTPIDDFDLLIGASSVTEERVIVTNNTRHLERINGIQIKDWTKE